MRELTVRMRFVKPCLGNIKGGGGRFLLPRDPAGAISFPPAWHAANVRFAYAALAVSDPALTALKADLGRVRWEPAIASAPSRVVWHKRHSQGASYALHEAIPAGEAVSFSCHVPDAVPDKAVQDLLVYAGRYRGLSPWRPGDFGHYELVSLSPTPNQGASPVSCPSPAGASNS
jgi:hypothetical protein